MLYICILFYTIVLTETVCICSLKLCECDSVVRGLEANRSRSSQNLVSRILEFREEFLGVPGILL
jgi:hypothetical protein